MKPVIQLEPTGCGIASVATLAGLSYRQVRQAGRRMGISADDRRLWSETDHVRRLLRHYGIVVARREARFVSWEDLPDLALLAIKWHAMDGRAFWHWVVFWRGASGAVVLDSNRRLRTPVRRDFGRMRPAWYLAVTGRRHGAQARHAHGPTRAALPRFRLPSPSG